MRLPRKLKKRLKKANAIREMEEWLNAELSKMVLADINKFVASGLVDWSKFKMPQDDD